MYSTKTTQHNNNNDDDNKSTHETTNKKLNIISQTDAPLFSIHLRKCIIYLTESQQR